MQDIYFIAIYLGFIYIVKVFIHIDVQNIIFLVNNKLNILKDIYIFSQILNIII